MPAAAAGAVFDGTSGGSRLALQPVRWRMALFGWGTARCGRAGGADKRQVAGRMRRRMTPVRLEKISKSFGAAVALRDVSLEVKAGELFFLLGPSGCGKSTLLRVIAGLQEPDSGRVFFGEEDVTSLPTQQRNAVMCFQSYALWPHMTVLENIRFGLSVRGLSDAEQKQRIDEVLSLVQMQDLAGRRPNQLSGGQQQRVALARALAVRPRCLLLDEPLSNLDARLRQEMRGEIRRICRSGAFTTIYVTHDQKEALSIADRIAVMKDGQVVQVGTPAELYHRPRSVFVADFIGQTNLLPAEVLGAEGGRVRLRTAAGDLWAEDGAGLAAGMKVTAGIRPEQMRICRGGAASAADNRLTGRAVEATFLGEASEHTIAAGGASLRVVAVPPLFEVPQELTVEFSAADVLVLRE